MRREDYANSEQKRLIAQFPYVYQQLLFKWAKHYKATTNLKGVTEHMLVHPEREVYQLIPEGEFSTLVEALRDKGKHDWAKKFYDAALDSMTEKVEEDLRRWYKREWNRQNLDYNLPTALSPKVTRIENTCWIVGSLRVWVEGRGNNREVVITTLDGSCCIYQFWIYSRQETSQKYKNVYEKCFWLALPEIKKINNLVDWTQANNLSKEQHRALVRRFTMVTNYYQNRRSYEYRLSDFAWETIKSVPDKYHNKWLAYLECEQKYTKKVS
jgi:hypothetical protein